MGLVLLGAGSAHAQVVWDSPMMMPPNAQRGLGLFLTDPASGNLGVLGTWRSGGAPNNLGFRIGLAEDRRDDVTIFGGIDIAGRLTRASSDFPLDIDWVFGAGASIGDFFWLAFPVGISVGHTFTGDGVRFTPYATPRVILDARFGDRWRGDKLDLDVAVDLGLDLQFQPGWAIRFGGTLGDREAVAIGVVF